MSIALIMLPAAPVRSPRHVERIGKTPVIEPNSSQRLFDSIPSETIAGARDKAVRSISTTISPYWPRLKTESTGLDQAAGSIGSATESGNSLRSRHPHTPGRSSCAEPDAVAASNTSGESTVAAKCVLCLRNTRKAETPIFHDCRQLCRKAWIGE